MRTKIGKNFAANPVADIPNQTSIPNDIHDDSTISHGINLTMIYSFWAVVTTILSLVAALLAIGMLSRNRKP